MNEALALEWAKRLEELGLAVRTHLLAVRGREGDLARPVAREGGDTIYEIPDSGRYNVILTNPPFGTRGANQVPVRDDFTIATSNKQHASNGER